ncbi:MAG: cellulose biosynthesis protein BcsS [Hyphomicrobiaceae bacterium]
MLAFFCVAIATTRADAQSLPMEASAPASARQMFEFSAGADAAAQSWSTYGALTTALYGDIRENGYRLRVQGGYGDYRYARFDADPAGPGKLRSDFLGEQTSINALFGYQWAIGSTTLKVYAGVAVEDHRLSSRPESYLDIDDNNAVQGQKTGAKVVIETWTRLADWGFFQLDANWSQPFETYSGRVRLGQFLGGGWSAGLEAAAFGNLDYDGGRAGAFVRYDWQGAEISVSGGLDGNLNGIESGYASIGLTTRF